MKSYIFIFLLLSYASFGQSNLKGKIIDAKTKAPLSRATIKVPGQNVESTSNGHGDFDIDLIDRENDSLEVSHLGYRTFKKALTEIGNPPIVIALEDYSIVLKTLTISSKNLNIRQIDNSLRRIKGNLYAYEVETTNGLYNIFLQSLAEDEQNELLRICDFDLSGYDEKTKRYYQNYAAPYKQLQNKNDSLINYTDFPAVNIRHEAAVLFCQWFSEQYNNHPGKKQFSKVKFRLPSLNEWQIAALGYPKFQSWQLDENMVDVVIPKDTISEMRQGKKTTIPVKGEILYPWWMAYNYRKKVQNSKNCFLGNFKIIHTDKPCPAQIPGYDGWTKTSLAAAYFPNGMGLSDVVGNVAEMLDEKGKACGGSWNDHPAESTIISVKRYNKANDTVGFRMFMEVIEE